MLNFLKALFGFGGPAITPEQLLSGTIIDVRSPGEFASGHVKGAQNIPLQDIPQAALKLRQMPQPIITCCASGRRSGIAASQLQAKGIEALNGGPWQQVRDLLNQ